MAMPPESTPVSRPGSGPFVREAEVWSGHQGKEGHAGLGGSLTARPSPIHDRKYRNRISTQVTDHSGGLQRGDAAGDGVFAHHDPVAGSKGAGQATLDAVALGLLSDAE